MIDQATAGLGVTLSSPQTEALWAGSVFLLALLGSVFAVRWIQKRWDPRRPKSADSPAGLTLEQIEAMYRSGSISEDEFKAMRKMVLRLSDPGSKKDAEDR